MLVSHYVSWSRRTIHGREKRNPRFGTLWMGRWLLILNTIESHGSKDRIVTKSVVNVLE